MNYIKYFITTILLLNMTVVSAQEEDFLLTFDNKKVEIIDILEYWSSDFSTLRYSGVDGKSYDVKSKEIKYIQYEEVQWVSIPNKKLNKGNLCHVVAYNKNYILIRTGNTNISATYLRILNRSDFTRVDHKKMYFLYGGKKNHVKENMKRLEYLKPFFGKCTDMLKVMEENINRYGLVHGDIDTYNCDNSPDLIESLIPYYKNFK